MAARRRKTRFKWFLPIGSEGPAADIEDDSNGIGIALTIPANGTTTLNVTPLIVDTPSDDIAPGNPLGFYEGNEYFIKRIVGKLFAGFTQAAASTGTPAVLLGAGLFVARAEDDDSGGPLVPIGAGSVAQLTDNYSPLRVENNREPWIWRRTWILSNRLHTAADAGGINSYPRTTSEYGSVADGPHVDAKTARRVKDGERLWWVLAGRNFPLNTTSNTAEQVTAYLDYRVLGAQRRSRNRSAF